MSDNNAGHWSGTGDIPPNKAVRIKAKDSLKNLPGLLFTAKTTLYKRDGKMPRSLMSDFARPSRGQVFSAARIWSWVDVCQFGGMNPCFSSCMLLSTLIYVNELTECWHFFPSSKLAPTTAIPRKNVPEATNSIYCLIETMHHNIAIMCWYAYVHIIHNTIMNWYVLLRGKTHFCYPHISKIKIPISSFYLAASFPLTSLQPY